MKAQFRSGFATYPLRYYAQLSNFCTGGSGYRTCLHSFAGMPMGLLAITVDSEHSSLEDLSLLIKIIVTDTTEV